MTLPRAVLGVLGLVLWIVAPTPLSAADPSCGGMAAFPDVPDTHPFCGWIKQLTDNGIATPCDGTNFCPDGPVTRAQLALYVGRLMALDSGRFLLLSGGSMTGGIDMQGSLVSNIGNAGTAFVSGGGLNVAGTLAANANTTLGDASSDTLAVAATIQGASPLVFEGATVDVNQTTLQVADPTVDRMVVLPNASGEVSVLGQTIESAEIADGTITFADIGANGCADGNVIRRSGSTWTCATVALPTVFQHQVTEANTSGNTSILDHASVNNKPGVKIFVTPDNTNGNHAGIIVGVRFVDLPDPLPDVWVLENLSSATALPLNAVYNVLVFP